MKWVPESEDWEGYIKYVDLPYPEKRRLQVSNGIKVSAKGEFLIENDDNMLLMSVAMYNIADKVIKEEDGMKLKHKESGQEVCSLQELCRYAEGESLMIAFGRSLLGGITLGKS